jgi:epoxyqueuosine reductase
MDKLNLADLFSLGDDEFRQRFRKTPLWRTRRRGILRNAAIVLGNQADDISVPALVIGSNDHEPIVRVASAWALGRIGSSASIKALKARSDIETDQEVRNEITAALDRFIK